MKLKIPFTFSDIEIAKRKCKYFLKFSNNKESKITRYLKNTGVDIDKRTYLAICYRNFFYNLLITSVIFTSILGLTPYIGLPSIENFLITGFGIALLTSGFILMNQYNYPRIYSLNKKRDLEKNLIPVLQDMLVQLNSGVPLFRIIANISGSDYGEVSSEFKKIISEINAGSQQIVAIEKYGKINTSEYFRRVLWQISNGMRAGSDMSIIINEEVKNLGKEQAIQIQSYGSKLNPLVMFYMLIAVILPSLGITFLIILASLLNFSGTFIKTILVFLFLGVIFIQIMFLGVIKSRRPTLL